MNRQVKKFLKERGRRVESVNNIVFYGEKMTFNINVGLKEILKNFYEEGETIEKGSIHGDWIYHGLKFSRKSRDNEMSLLLERLDLEHKFYYNDTLIFIDVS